MKVLIAVFSRTGNTARVARAIHQEVLTRGHEVDLREVGQVTAKDLDDYDLVFLGSACHDTDLARPVKRLLKRVGDSPPFKLAGFCTHATYVPGEIERTRGMYEKWAGNCARTLRRVSEDKQIAFLGYYHCLGAPSPPIAAFIHHCIVRDEREWATYIADVRDRPDEDDLRQACEFAAQVLEAY